LSDIVFISDASCDQGKADKTLYTASKSAMESLMRSQAVAFAPKVKVNAVAPGLLAFHETDDEDYRQRRLSQTLLGVEPGFKPVIDAIDYLFASSYTTGSRLVVDGGASLRRN
jgi:dihydromonapterin reductase/dihydrofolate reductase